ncbi:MAG: HupE/UreJ family protein [Gomphosphaeria aponina SAG 52.96 = DSM 107014]|uniref:HupE/UreJ family protein n=1 Tax=Gomphosphaeria aponina SAG 52.96 = DSM 107014 TaxID=1521640 RepID=A0A941GSB2_9CHRO|nr:HupE/UreJ family protein [Gomphosphaeria aponina SAG 52.96 = DSM 107014]
MGVFITTQQAMAHHAFGGETPDNFMKAFLSGLAHPVIGIDHLGFVVASGLIAAGQTLGFFIPVAFVFTALVGTGIHVLAINLPFPELMISASVIAFGVLLAISKGQGKSPKYFGILEIGLAAIAGIFHGYAYGESIVGAEMTPLVGYLVGFTLIQLFIAGLAFLLGKMLLNQANLPFPVMRFLGILIGAMGVVFLTYLI